MKVLLSKVRETLRKKRTRKILMRFVSVFSAAIVFITTYALILPAITLELKASCGIEEHQHSDKCYEERLICGQEEGGGHHHDDSCYEVRTELDCEVEEHQHSAEDGCYDADGNLVCELTEHVHDDSCYRNVKTLVCEEKESDGHHHTDECYEKVLVCKKEVHTHSEKCYEQSDPGAPADETSKAEGDDAQGDMTSKTEDAAADETAAASDEELISEPYVPELDPLNMEAVLDQHTDFYYFHAEKGEEVPADSSDISDWRQVEKDTDLASTDLVKLYLAYSIPAGSLNKTNPIARYRLPGNIHLTDEQIKAINKNENGFYAGLVNSDAADSAGQYLGAEAVEGDRTPDRLLQDDEQEYISAVVRAENVYEDDRYLGQDLIFTFIPYTIEKNQDTYDAEQNPVSAGEAVTGWFACDFQLDQIDWEEEENEIADAHTEDGTGGRVEKAVRKTADILFVEKNEEENIEEISRLLRLVEETAEEYQSGTLTADGDGYKVRLDYTEEAQIPEDAALSVCEITPETDEEAYKSCLAQAREHVSGSGDEKSEVDTKASRFFDIEILVTEEDGTVRKIEPAAPVQVSIQIPEAAPETSVPGSESRGAQKADPRVLHFAEDGVEQVDSTTMTGDASSEDSNEGANKDTDADTGAGAGTDSEAETTSGNGEVTQVQFEAESFSVYGLVYTVDFHYEINGKMYDFSIPGGGFVSLEHVVEVLGIASADENTEKGTENAENDAENGNDFAGEVPGVDENGENGTVYEEAIKLNEVEVSESTKKFVMDVESVEFSSPELVWVGKVDEATTVGGLKEVKGLEVEYSTELTEEQIAEINAQTVEAGDWALISLQPFTSEEILTVTMNDGEVFTIKIKDGQLHTYVISDSGDTYEVIVTYDDTSEIPEDAELKVREIKDTEKEYNRNIETANKELQAQEEMEVEKPVQFDIAIIAGGVEVEPKEGSIVNVEIRLAPEAFEGETSDDEGEIWFNGEMLGQSKEEEAVHYTGVHIKDDGTAEIIEDIRSSVDQNEKIILQFDTESFSTYIIDGVSASSGNNHGTVNDLPNAIYVGDVIYIWNNPGEYVNANGCVQDTSINNNNTYRELKATSTGYFQIGNKRIQVLPERQGTTPPPTIETIDNASIGITMNLFDYDLNGVLDDYYNSSSHYDNNIIGYFAGQGINSGHALKFWGSGIGNNYGSANEYKEHGVTSIVQTNLVGGIGGYPQLTRNSNSSNSTESLEYLFSPSDGTDKKAYTNVNGLFKKEGDYYVYDSNVNYAWYNPSTNKFEVYNKTYNQVEGKESGSVHRPPKKIGFFPFHRYDEDYDLYVNWNKHLNHHFGLSMSVPFSLPKDPKAVVDTTGEPIIFEFSGDDDLWVFIDGKLAMDIGGIHQPTSGTINFQTGVVTVNNSTQMNTSTFNSRFQDLYDGKQHTLQVFYIERGGADSNCKIMFNLTQYGDIHFDKVDKDNPSDKLAGAVFGIYKDEECTIPLLERLNAANNNISRAYVAESDAQGHVQFSDIPIGTYYLKELHAPEGYPLDSTVHTVNVYYDEISEQVKVKVTIDGHDVESGVNIENKKPAPIDLGLHKVWQNADGESITVPEGVQATFEIKRIRNYETYTEQKIQGEGRPVSHLTIGWIHNGQTHVHAEYDLIAETQTTVSWGYKNGYEGTIGYVLNGTEQTKQSNPNNIYSQAFTMPAADGSATFYVIDNSENGEAITNINVAGSQYYGNSGGGVIHTFETFTEPDPYFTYTGDYVTSNQVTLPINSNTWSYNFVNLPTFSRGTVLVEGVEQEVAFNYSYYLEEVSSISPNGTTVVYKDSKGKTINSPTDAETSVSGTQTIINQIHPGALELTKIVTFNNADDTTTKTDGIYKFTISGIDDTFTTGISHTVEITFANGRATKYKIDSVETSVTGTSNTWSVLLSDLMPGDYIITETDSGPLTLEEITGGKNNGNKETKKVTVTVSPGKNTSAALLDTAKASFKNNKSETEVTLKKVDAVSKSPINGAKFSLKAGMEYADLTKLTITNLSDGTEAAIEDLTTLTGTIKVINVPVSGIKIAGLPNGDYTLKEEKAPDGYVITNGGIDFTATDGTIGKPDAENGFTFVVENEPGAALPNTGGPGTSLFYLLGIMLTCFSGGGIVMRRRKNAA